MFNFGIPGEGVIGGKMLDVGADGSAGMAVLKELTRCNQLVMVS